MSSGCVRLPASLSTMYCRAYVGDVATKVDRSSEAGASHSVLWRGIAAVDDNHILLLIVQIGLRGEP